MKKLFLFISILCICSFVLTSCTTTGNNTQTTSGETTTEIPTTQQSQAELQKELKLIEDIMLSLLNSENLEEVSGYVIEADELYVEALLNSFPHDDYIITAEKLGTHKEYVAYNIIAERESDPEYYVSGMQIFVKTDKGYMITIDDEVVNEICETYVCLLCDGSGYVDGSEDVAEICERCDGVGFKF